MTRKIIRKSCHGTEYSIPENMLNLFAHLDEAVEHSEFGSDEEQTATDEFLLHFAEFEKSYV